MKRDEKNQQTRRRTLDRALSEFSEKGYGGSSVNTICAVQGISKGIVLLIPAFGQFFGEVGIHLLQ